MTINIRSLEMKDFPGWLPLWDGNNMGIRNEDVTAETWSRICNPDSAVNGIGAWEGATMVGLVHYILHPTTGHIEPVCYMQDVYTAPAHRQKGIARKLVQKLVSMGKKEKWARLYWLAEADNEAAQALYKTIGIKLNFTLHVQPLG